MRKNKNVFIIVAIIFGFACFLSFYYSAAYYYSETLNYVNSVNNCFNDVISDTIVGINVQSSISCGTIMTLKNKYCSDPMIKSMKFLSDNYYKICIRSGVM